jgi:hypothetical protein
VHDEFLDLDRLFLAALHNPLNGEHRVASHSQLPRVAPAQLRVRSDGCVPIVESRPLLRRDEPRTFPIARGPNPCAEWGQRGAADRTRRRLMCSAFRAGRPGLRGRRAALTGENLEGRAGGTMLSPAPGKSNRQEHEGPLRTGMTERCRKLFQVGQIAGTSLAVNGSFASRSSDLNHCRLNPMSRLRLSSTLAPSMARAAFLAGIKSCARRLAHGQAFPQLRPSRCGQRQRL